MAKAPLRGGRDRHDDRLPAIGSAINGVGRRVREQALLSFNQQ
jgi:hypothetical protein